MIESRTLVRESPLRALLKRHGVDHHLLEAARCALKSPKRDPYQYRRDIIASALLGAGIYVVATVAGGKLHFLAALAMGAGMVLLFKLIDRPGIHGQSDDLDRLIFHTRYGIDFNALGTDLHQADAALAHDLRAVLLAGIEDPGALSNYSILHLWECIRVRIAEFEVPV